MLQVDDKKGINLNNYRGLDTCPSILFLGYGNPLKKIELIKELKSKGYSVREPFLLDVGINYDEMNDALNYFKHFINIKWWVSRMGQFTNSFYYNLIVNKFFNKLGYEKIEIKDLWDSDNRHKFLNVMLMPLMFQNINKDVEDLKKYNENVRTFTTIGYKSKITGVVKPDDMDLTHLEK